MKPIFLSLLALFSICNNVSAEQDTYRKYNYPHFNHLEFDIPTEWEPIQNNLEVVFTKRAGSPTQLFFQAVGKTKDFNDSLTFLEFLKKQSPNDQYHNIRPTKSSGHSALTFNYSEQEYPNIDTHGLIIDVGEGILWFYLKSPNVGNGTSHPIIDRIITSLGFK